MENEDINHPFRSQLSPVEELPLWTSSTSFQAPSFQARGGFHLLRSTMVASPVNSRFPDFTAQALITVPMSSIAIALQDD